MYYIAIDLGTTNIKVSFYNNRFEQLSQRSHTVVYDRSGSFVEFDAKAYSDHVLHLIRMVLEDVSVREHDAVYCVGLTGQAESLVILDAAGIPLRKGISWLDNRSMEECKELSEVFPESIDFSITGQQAIIPTWPITKMLWIKRHEPDIFYKAAKYLLLKDYINYRLTGLFCGEYSIYNFSHYFDIRKKSYWLDILNYVGINMNQLPQLQPSGSYYKGILPESALMSGLPENTIVNLGTLDHFASMIGTNSYLKNRVSVSLGTVLSMAMLTDSNAFEQSLLPVHCGTISDSYIYLPVCESGAISLSWFVEQISSIDGYNDLNDNCNSQEPSPNLVFLPYLTGSNSPENISGAKGVFFGLTVDVNRYQMAIAVMEGVACLIRKNMEYSNNFDPDTIIIVTGGGAKSDYWCQIIANITGHTVAVPQNSEAACLGTAMLCAVCNGVYNSISQAASSCVKIKKYFSPDTNMNTFYNEKYNLFLRVFEAVLPLFNINT
jgi:xylulokinase